MTVLNDSPSILQLLEADAYGFSSLRAISRIVCLFWAFGHHMFQRKKKELRGLEWTI